MRIATVKMYSGRVVKLAVSKSAAVGQEIKDLLSGKFGTILSIATTARWSH